MKRTKPFPLSREKILEATNLAQPELRFLVANYYQSQRMRKTMDMQKRHLGERLQIMPENIKAILNFATEGFASIEDSINNAFPKILKSPVATWIQAQRGFGPIIAAGLLAHIDITKAPTAGHIWRFAGLDPTQKWASGQKRPYNAELRRICWHAGQCIMKQSNDPDCFYGQLYRSRKQYEIERNETGGNVDRAKTFKVNADASKEVKEKLAKGQLPDFNIDARARLYAVKIFLSHLQAIMYWDHYKKAPPKPHALAILGHAHEIYIPWASMFPGFAEAYYGSARRD